MKDISLDTYPGHILGWLLILGSSQFKFLLAWEVMFL